MTTEQKQAMEWAKRRARQLKGFYTHLVWFLFVAAILVGIDLATGGPGRFLGLDWAFWPIGGWGIGVAAHGLSLSQTNDDSSWEDRKARELYEKRIRSAGPGA